MHWGFDIVDFIKRYTGMDTIIEYPFNFEYGVWAEYIEVFVSRKEPVIKSTLSTSPKSDRLEN